MGNVVSLETLIGYYENSVELSYEARQKAERDRDFYDGKQWTHEESRELTRRGQSPVVVNKLAGKIDWMLGMERQLRSDPKAVPRTPNHDEAAKAATDGIRYVVDNVDFDAIASDAAEQLFIEGIESVTVEVEPKGNDFEIVVRGLRWDRFFCDPHSRKHDFSDAKYLGFVTWMDMDDAKRQFGAKKKMLQQHMNQADAGDTYDDKPTNAWYDKKRNRVMLVQMCFHEGGKWYHAIFARGVYLSGPEESPYLDADGLPEPYIIAQSAKMDRDGNRYGAARQYIDPQKELNKRRSKFLHLLNNRQTIGEQGAVKDVGAMKREMAKPDGHVEVNPNMRFELLNTQDMGMGQFQLYQAASAEIDAMGANPALQGKHEGDASGYALERREQGGLTEMGPFFDAHRVFKRRIYRAIWNRIRQYWGREKWVRVTDEEQNLEWVGLNVPVTQAEAMVMQESGMDVGEVRSQFGDQIKMLTLQNPALGQVVETRNNVAELDVDIIIDDSPNSVNVQAEEFDKLVQMYTANPQGVPWEVVVEASNLRSKGKILEAAQGDPEQMQAALQEQQMVKRLAMQKAAAEIERLQAQSAKDRASAAKTAVETEQTQIENTLVGAFPDLQPNVNI